MNTKQIGRHIKEGIKSISRNGWMTFISLISVIVTLLIVGVFNIIILNINHITKGVEDNVEVVVYIDLTADEKKIKKIETDIKKLDKVKTIKFINKDEGLKNLIKDLGEQGKAFESLKEDNPLNDTFVVKTKNPRDTELLAKEIENFKFVEKVDYGGDIVDTLFNITKTVRNIGLVLIFGLILTATLLIANTIRMTIEMRKQEIKIMRLVGATDWFIKTPFIIEGAFLGFIGSLVPIIILNISYVYLLNSYEKSISFNFVDLLPLGEIFLPITLMLIILSVLIGMIGSSISIRKYLNS